MEYEIMSFLNSVKRNKAKTERVIIYGESGLGKTTFATSAPNPIVIQTEDGLGEIDVPCFPLAESYIDVMKALDSLANEDHDFKTVVIDSLDWLETLIWKQVCTDNKVSSIEKIGYGRGYNEALVFWSYFFDELNKCRDKGMLVIMTAHSQVNKVEDPEISLAALSPPVTHLGMCLPVSVSVPLIFPNVTAVFFRGLRRLS